MVSGNPDLMRGLTIGAIVVGNVLALWLLTINLGVAIMMFLLLDGALSLYLLSKQD